jgi:hypothetical protein
MPNLEPSEAARTLVAAHVDTLEKLEVVIAAVSQPAKTWTLDGMARDLNIAALHLRTAIDALRAAGILRLVPGLRYRLVYAPSSPSMRAACAALASDHAADREAVVRLVRARELDRMRSPADEFAEAFRIRQPDEVGDDE